MDVHDKRRRETMLSAMIWQRLALGAGAGGGACHGPTENRHFICVQFVAGCSNIGYRMKNRLLLCAVLSLVGNRFILPDLHAAPVGMAERLIEKLHMTQIPQEGPWFTVNYEGKDRLPGSALPARYHGRDHATGSAIYAVMTNEDFSALHRLQTDETWHFYGGDPIEMLLLYPDGHGEIVILGPDVFAGQKPQFTVPQGVWQGSAPVAVGPEAYSFFGDQLAPAFDYHDFEIGYRDELRKTYPQYAARIDRLTREEFAARPAAIPATAAAEPDTLKPATVLTADAIKPPVEVAPGMFLSELVGRTGIAGSELQSVAHFTLKKGHSTLTSHNKVSEETFLIVSGHGRVTIKENAQDIGPGSFVMMQPGVSHKVSANADEDLEFYAIESPAYSPEDFVEEHTQN